MSDFVDWFQLIASKRGVPDGWSWFSSEFKGETRSQGVFLIKGSCISGTYTRGKNKGKPKRDMATMRELVITPAELDAVKTQWERDTNQCSGCYGEGQSTSGISNMNGETVKTYRSCRRCNGTGQAVQP